MVPLIICWLTKVVIRCCSFSLVLSMLESSLSESVAVSLFTLCSDLFLSISRSSGILRFVESSVDVPYEISRSTSSSNDDARESKRFLFLISSWSLTGLTGSGTGLLRLSVTGTVDQPPESGIVSLRFLSVSGL